VLTKEVERAGLPTSHISALTPVAQMVGSNRIIPASSVLHPVGDPNRDPAAEKAFRRIIVEEAIRHLQDQSNR
jgi:glycine reductase